ncbi:MAG: hypothetical protein IIC81_09705 [Chloroflexi bacterium]|nr:hypothetical protein [Chloroflexota bacterium]
MVVKNRRGKGVARVERRLFHIVAGSLFPLLALVLPQWIIILLAATGTGASIVLEISRRRSRRVNDCFTRRFSVLLKESESSQTLGSTYLLAATLLAFLLFDRDVAVLALLFLAVGDPLAALVGQRYGRARIRKKSVEGSLAFMAGAALVGWLLIAGGLDISLWVVMSGAAVAALVELLSLPPDDNITVPLVAGAVMTPLM